MRLSLPVEVTTDTLGGWGFTLWVGQYGACEDAELRANTMLCRSAVADLLRLLGRTASAELTMPPVEAIEITIEERLRWNEVDYRLTINTLDGAVSLCHAQREPLESLLGAIEDDLHQASND